MLKEATGGNALGTLEGVFYIDKKKAPEVNATKLPDLTGAIIIINYSYRIFNETSIEIHFNINYNIIRS